METYSNNRTRNMVLISIFIAIIIIQSFVPALGYINISGLSMTIIHITVIVATVALGTKSGVVVGLVWGVLSLVIAWMRGTPFERLIFSDPFVSILPRVLMPLIVGFVAQQMLKRDKSYRTVGITTGILGSLLNTVLVIGSMLLFKGSEIAGSMEGVNTLWGVLSALVGINGLFEAVLGGILVPIILVALSSILKRTAK